MLNIGEYLMHQKIQDLRNKIMKCPHRHLSHLEFPLVPRRRGLTEGNICFITFPKSAAHKGSVPDKLQYVLKDKYTYNILKKLILFLKVNLNSYRYNIFKK